MSGVGVKHTARFRNSRAEGMNSTTADKEPRPPITRLARQLALAHHTEWLIDYGTFANHAEAAQQLGVSRTRMAQIMRLLTLSPVVQEAILSGKVEVSERAVRPVVETVLWREQEVLSTGQRSPAESHTRETTSSKWNMNR